jgi:hypothetical protein
MLFLIIYTQSRILSISHFFCALVEYIIGNIYDFSDFTISFSNNLKKRIMCNRISQTPHSLVQGSTKKTCINQYNITWILKSDKNTIREIQMAK